MSLINNESTTEAPIPISSLGSMMDIGFFRFAKNVSKHSIYRVQIGAVIVKKNHPISVGFNTCKTHPVFSNPEITDRSCVHAEIKALITADFNVENCDIYVYREYKFGVPALARPCENCIKHLRDAGIKRMYYSIGEYPYWNSEKL